jgi:hypothetical protein
MPYDASYEAPAYPMAPEIPAPGSRQNWPLNPPSENDEAVRARPAYEPAQPPHESAIPRQRDGRIAPPWQSDEIPIPVGPPALRLVGPDEQLQRTPSAYPNESYQNQPYQSQKEPSYQNQSQNEPSYQTQSPQRTSVGYTGSRADALRDRRPYNPVDAEADGDLLIFAQARSAWFEWPDEAESEPERPEWTDIDAGWSVAARAEHPEVSSQTEVGLPRRVPQANLVPGSPLPPITDQSLRIVRDPASMAAHTTGYFRGSRRGEEVRGYAVGGRTGRESGGGWDFSRDGWDSDRDTGYRSAARR